MSQYPSEKIRITPLAVSLATAGATALNAKTLYNGQGNFSVLCGVRAAATTATGWTATAAMNWDFTVTESSAATVNATAITGAALSLGATAAFTMKGGVNCILKVTTDCATTAGVTINGIRYIGTAVGEGDVASSGSMKISRAINGHGTSAKLPHYTALANYTAKDLVLITADDDMGTGLTVTCTAGSGIQVFMNHLQGVIDVQGSKLSTVTPKYIGVNIVELTGANTSVAYAQMISYPTGKPGMPGVKVSCTT